MKNRKLDRPAASPSAPLPPPLRRLCPPGPEGSPSPAAEEITTTRRGYSKLDKPRTMGDVLKSKSSSSSNNKNNSFVSPTRSAPAPPLPAPLPPPPRRQPPLTPPPSPPPVTEEITTTGRGYGKGVPEWKSGVKVEVLFDSNFQPVGDRATQLKSQLGKIVRDGHRIPLTILDWKSVDQSVKDGIWKEVKENVVNVPEGYKDICMRSCNNLWKDHKSKTKNNFFEKNKDDPDLINNPPGNIVANQWADLVAYWSSEEAKAISRRNSCIRERRGPLHTTGRKHSAQIRYEMEKDGKETDKMSVWKNTRNMSNPDVAIVIEEYDYLLSKEPEDQRNLHVVKDCIFHLVMGDDGHCRTFGSDVPRKVVYPQASTSSGHTNDLLQQLTETVAQIGETVAQIGDKVERFGAQLTTIERKIQILEGIIGNEVDQSLSNGEEQNASLAHHVQPNTNEE